MANSASTLTTEPVPMVIWNGFFGFAFAGGDAPSLKPRLRDGASRFASRDFGGRAFASRPGDGGGGEESVVCGDAV